MCIGKDTRRGHFASARITDVRSMFGEESVTSVNCAAVSVFAQILFIGLQLHFLRTEATHRLQPYKSPPEWESPRWTIPPSHIMVSAHTQALHVRNAAGTSQATSTSCTFKYCQTVTCNLLCMPATGRYNVRGERSER